MFSEKSFLKEYFDDYVRQNNDARNFMHQIENCKFDISALVDHCTIRAFNIEHVAKWLYTEGFEKVSDGEINMGDWFLQVFYKPGYPTIVVDQPNHDKILSSGGGRIIYDWIVKFGYRQFHHVAVRVQEIEKAVHIWTQWGVPFVGDIACDIDTGLKQIFTKPMYRDGHPFTVLEFIERPPGCTGLVVKNADKLVKSVRS
ncbi:MAG: hypothetical protein HYT28_02505 [Parcubacteria group bacterium]|nr:hypothetical protein [Parcubacteria group bacterium]